MAQDIAAPCLSAGWFGAIPFRSLPSGRLEVDGALDGTRTGGPQIRCSFAAVTVAGLNACASSLDGATQK